MSSAIFVVQHRGNHVDVLSGMKKDSLREPNR